MLQRMSLSGLLAPWVGRTTTADKSCEINKTPANARQPEAPRIAAPTDACQPREFVYVAVGGAGLLKIGKARDVAKRLKQLQTGSAHRINLAYSVQCFPAYLIERLVHDELKDFRANGEWFCTDVNHAKEAIARALKRAASEAAYRVLRQPAIQYKEPRDGGKVEAARQAILQFLSQMETEDDDAPVIKFKSLQVCYGAWREKNGWPPLTDKTLSMALEACGCIKTTVDARHQGRGRYVAFELPRKGTP